MEENTMMAGAMPKDTRSARESNSTPNLPVARRARAAAPSKRSKHTARRMNQPARYAFPYTEKKQDMVPKVRLVAVRPFGTR